MLKDLLCNRGLPAVTSQTIPKEPSGQEAWLPSVSKQEDLGNVRILLALHVLDICTRAGARRKTCQHTSCDGWAVAVTMTCPHLQRPDQGFLRCLHLHYIISFHESTDRGSQSYNRARLHGHQTSARTGGIRTTVSGRHTSERCRCRAQQLAPLLSAHKEASCVASWSRMLILLSWQLTAEVGMGS